MIKLGALWKPKEVNENGPVLSGQINDQTRIVIFKNGFKKEANQPDYILYVQENEKKPKPAGKGSFNPRQAMAEEDVPF